jgi:mono/diheme cytochrome c family protein
MGKAARPIALLVVVVAIVFALAEAHVLKPSTPKAAAGSSVQLGDAYRGETVFQQKCAGCHGTGGEGGGVGPKLAGAPLTPAAVKAQIDAGGGVMPAALVTGGGEADVIAYVASIAAQ